MWQLRRQIAKPPNFPAILYVLHIPTGIADSSSQNLANEQVAEVQV